MPAIVAVAAINDRLNRRSIRLCPWPLPPTPHVAGRIGATTLQWLDVIDDEPRARPRGLARRRTGVRCQEGPAGGRRELDSAAAVAHAGGAPRRRRSGDRDGGAAL